MALRPSGPSKLERQAPREKRPIFFDPAQRRWSLLKLLGGVLLLASFVWGIAFGASLYALAKLTALDPQGDPGTTAVAPTLSPVSVDSSRAGSPSLATSPLGPVAPSTTVYAYLPFQPEWSYQPLAQALPKIDVLLPEWFQLNLKSATLEPLGFEEPHQRAIAQLLRNRSATTLLPVASLDDEVTGPEIAAVLNSPESIRRLEISIIEAVAVGDYRGLCLNLSGMPEVAYAGAAKLFTALHARFQETGRQTCLAVPLASTVWDDKPLMSVVDRAVVLGFRDPRMMTGPGPLAPQPWFAQHVASLLAAVEPDKVVLALGAMGQDWTDDAAFAPEINYAEAMRLAGLHAATISFDRASLNTTFAYSADGRRHQVWLLDAASTYNELVALSGRAPGGIAIWPLTGADPAIWNLVPKHQPVDLSGALLGSVDISDYVGYQGAGPFQHLLRVPQQGVRVIETDPSSRLIIDAAYTRIPQPYTIQRYGADTQGTVALTFDDGPDPRFTAEILDILRSSKVPATFFVVGKNALEHPDLVSRMVAEGHEVGVHTFFHPALDHTSSWRIRFEVNSTERLIAGITGRKTLLFRSPYGFGKGPLTGGEETPMRQIEQYGYRVVGADITPRDWTGATPDDLVAAIASALKPATVNVIQLHDAGGDRAATVKALPRIIAFLRQQGYQVVPLSALLAKSRNDLMPIDDSFTALLDAWSFTAIRWIAHPFYWLFIAVTVLGSARAMTVVLLAYLRKPHAAPATSYSPPVTVVIAAYCEEPVIAQTLSSVLASDFPEFRVLVVDDGSTDRTAMIVNEIWGSDPRVRLVTQPNGGKFNALNHAYAAIDSEIVVAIDADTTVSRDAIRRLVRHFQDPQVGAVAGNVKVGNRHSLMTRLQSLEYVTAQNIDRRAAEVFNGILVVPGAIGAWRRAAVMEAGCYSPDTLAEDADLTVSIARAGYRVVFEETAIATTEAPETVRQFMRQRLRWMLGMLQMAWKHRGAVAQRHWLGLVSIPELLLFSVMVATVAPIVDLMFGAALLNYAVDLFLVPQPAVATLSAGTVAAYSIYLLSDLLVGILAFRFEPGEDKRLLWLLPFQRLLYRQLLYASAMRALYVALSGRLMQWQKVSRSGQGQGQIEPVSK